MKKLATLSLIVLISGCVMTPPKDIITEAAKIKNESDSFLTLKSKMDKSVETVLEKNHLNIEKISYSNLGRDSNSSASYIINSYFEGDDVNKIYVGKIKLIQDLGNGTALATGDYESNIFLLSGLNKPFADGSIFDGMVTLNSASPIYKYTDVRGSERSVYSLIAIYPPSSDIISNMTYLSYKIQSDTEYFRRDFGIEYKEYQQNNSQK